MHRIERTSRRTRAAAEAVASLAAAASALPVLADARTPPTAHAAIALSVETRSAQDVGPTSATLRLRVNSLLGATTVFQLGPTTAYGAVSERRATSLIGLDEEILIPVADLQPGTTYHFRASAYVGASVVYGADRTFTTADSRSGSGSGTGTTTTAPTPTAPAPSTTTPTTTTTTPPRSTTTATPARPGGEDGATTGDDDDATATAGDDGVSASPEATAGVRPVLGASVAVAAVKGTVTVLDPTGAPTTLDAATALPTGTIIDTRRGTVELTSARNAHGATQTGRFWGGVFEVRQSTAGKGLTQLVLRGGDFSRCTPAPVVPASPAQPVATASAIARAAAANPTRSLWGSDKQGRFQTRGRGSVATVRGTRWVTEDWCRGTITRVQEGAVSVRDLRLRRDVLVRRGGSYLAKVAS